MDTVVFICISLMTNEVEHVYMCIFAICILFQDRGTDVDVRIDISCLRSRKTSSRSHSIILGKIVFGDHNLGSA